MPRRDYKPLEETPAEEMGELTAAFQVEDVAGATYAHGTPAPDANQVRTPVKPGEAVAGITHAHGTPAE